MTIQWEYDIGVLGNRSKDIFQFQMIFHSIKCNKTMEITLFDDDDASTVGFKQEFTIYLSNDFSTDYFTKYNFILDAKMEDELHVIDDHFRHADLFVHFRSGASEVSTLAYG
ncbi:hypothetical protein RF11_16278 [Thelohanellus kitauei]|uniref:Uncharacterized protein n=1 Tax=Thelohanellus kitauei TaxID=669202 RepID=A0A0C2I516_THEKT|nr:hypothetical protein RF11_16278 [Thelohanellus kitauei]